MIRKSVLPKQSILDVTLQHSGTIEQLFEVMKANNLTNLFIEPTLTFYIPTVVHQEIVSFFVEEKRQPASLLTDVNQSLNLLYTTNIEIANTDNNPLIKA